MKIEIINGYDESKKQICNELLENKKREEINLKSFLSLYGYAYSLFLCIPFVIIIFAFLFKGPLEKSLYGNTGFKLFLFLFSFGLSILIAIIIGFIIDFLEKRNEYIEFDKNIKDLSMDEIFDCLNNKKFFDDHESFKLKIKKEILDIFLSLLSNDIDYIEAFIVKNYEKSISVVVNYKNGTKESFILEDVNYEYKNVEEDELVYDNGHIILYSKNF